jgi:hypothetical protein
LMSIAVVFNNRMVIQRGRVVKRVAERAVPRWDAAALSRTR